MNRVRNVTALRDGSQLASSSTAMDRIARHRVLEECMEEKKAEPENTFTKFFHTHRINFFILLSAKKKKKKLPLTFGEARKLENLSRSYLQGISSVDLANYLALGKRYT